ncbi:hypothetical protein GD597_00545 [Panacibacter sp. KCS-6]|uniref:Cytochrome c domain-containing protein n=2 Tax=Limnovirga soli TaxID=2656915 RepID=A0A8J8FCN1_9BACT|nr:hypothetical protein [Limnovirga soli]
MPGHLLMNLKYTKTMQRWKTILYNTALCFNCLLLFLLLFYNSIAVPAWVQVLGRMHPLIIHFPIVLLLLYVIWQIWIYNKLEDVQLAKSTGELLLLAAAASAAITALMGVLLSKESGYDADALAWHKWTGSGLAFVSFAWYLLRNRITHSKAITLVLAITVCITLIITGELGSAITRGEDYLLAPVLPKQQAQQVAFDDAVVFTNMVEPILKEKCVGCHNSKKAKGELLMETTAQLLKGGKDGALWNTSNPSLSLLLKRVHLPLEEEKHMPPKGKPQLTDEEIMILNLWIQSGASFTTKVATLPANDSLRNIAATMFTSDVAEVYDFAAASDKTIAGLTNNNRVITPIAEGSPALTVDFYNSGFYNQKALQELQELKEQIVYINLSKMPVQDDDITLLSQFANLRELNISFTPITGKNLAVLSKLPKLKELSLAGTKVNAKDVQVLATSASLKKIFLWNTGITDDALKLIAKANSSIHFETGFNGDTVIMKLNAPILQNEETVILDSLPLQLKHYVNGTTIRYTLDGKDPDSLQSPIYKQGMYLKQNGILKAKAFKPGWISSDVTQAYFYKNTFTPDVATLVTPADDSYKGDGAKTIIDHIKSDNNFRNGKWLGYHGTLMNTLLHFQKPVQVQNITISSLVDIGGYIFPPLSIEVWGGNTEGSLKLLGRLTPKQPTMSAPGYLQGYDINFTPATLQYIKLKVQSVPKLPVWHPGKGDKAWFFTDEVFIN